jgi:hypothetical protein
MARECTEPRDPSTITCRNCEQGKLELETLQPPGHDSMLTELTISRF